MTEESRPVDLVRLPRPETIYDREAFLGRDTASVFPRAAKQAKQADLEKIKKAVGLDSSRFITETQLAEIKKEQGPSVENGSIARDKTLAAILAENKARKEEQFQSVWKGMKQGKNRPLDDDELDFVNKLADQEQRRLQEMHNAEKDDLAAFQEAVQRRAEEQTRSATSLPEVPSQDGSGVPASTTPMKLNLIIKPTVKVKAAARSSKSSGSSSKKPRVGLNESQGSGRTALLSDLIGGYGSDSDAK